MKRDRSSIDTFGAIGDVQAIDRARELLDKMGPLTKTPPPAPRNLAEEGLKPVSRDNRQDWLLAGDDALDFEQAYNAGWKARQWNSNVPAWITAKTRPWFDKGFDEAGKEIVL